MKSITIRNVPDDVHRHFRMRAASNGRSLEAELRFILETLTKARKSKAKLMRGEEIALTAEDKMPEFHAAMVKVRDVLTPETTSQDPS